MFENLAVVKALFGHCQRTLLAEAGAVAEASPPENKQLRAALRRAFYLQLKRAAPQAVKKIPDRKIPAKLFLTGSSDDLNLFIVKTLALGFRSNLPQIR